MEGNPMEGLVLRLDGKAVLLDVGGREVKASLRGRLFEKADKREKRPIAVGDRVLLEMEGQEAVVTEVLPRKTTLCRVSSSEERKRQVVAANVDQVALVASLRKPEPFPPLLDRILAAALWEGIEPILVFNKLDLDQKNAAEEWKRIYQGTGFPILFTSVPDKKGLEELKEKLRGKTTAFAGPSGSGKSSLLNALEPGLSLRTGEVGRKGVHPGRHTTTSALLLKLSFGGYVVDTPGVRVFEVWGIPKRELPGLFPEFAPYQGQCAFHDCTHVHEPDCAVRRAVEEEKIPLSRYRSYLSILEELSSEGS